MADAWYAGVLSAAAGAVFGALATWNKDRVTAREHIMEFLRDRRLELDSDTGLLNTIGLLKDELQGEASTAHCSASATGPAACWQTCLFFAQSPLSLKQ